LLPCNLRSPWIAQRLRPSTRQARGHWFNPSTPHRESACKARFSSPLFSAPVGRAAYCAAESGARPTRSPNSESGEVAHFGSGTSPQRAPRTAAPMRAFPNLGRGLRGDPLATLGMLASEVPTRQHVYGDLEVIDKDVSSLAETFHGRRISTPLATKRSARVL
jgi:hypothetical protein